MKIVYKKIYPVTTNDKDWCNRLTPTAILNFAQDSAGRHATELGLGFDPLVERGLLWILLRVKFEVVGDSLSSLDQVEVITWPEKPGRIELLRNFVINKTDGTPLVKGVSSWVIIDIEHKMIQRSSVIDYGLGEFVEQVNFEGRFKKLELLDELEEEPRYQHLVGYRDIDQNRHMNNTAYVSVITDMLKLGDTEEIKHFHIDYIKEVQYGETIELSMLRKNKTIEIGGWNKGELSLRACVNLKD